MRNGSVATWVGVAIMVKHIPDIIRPAPEDRIAAIEVAVFLGVVLVYMFVLYGLGFRPASFLLLTLTLLCLTLEKTRRNLTSVVVVPVVTCIVAYIIFLHVIYVPFPQSDPVGGHGRLEVVGRAAI